MMKRSGLTARLLSVLLTIVLLVGPLAAEQPARATDNWYDDVAQVVMTKSASEIYYFDFNPATRELHYRSSNQPEVIFPLSSFDSAMGKVFSATWSYLDKDGNNLSVSSNINGNINDLKKQLRLEVYGQSSKYDQYSCLAYEKNGFDIPIEPTGGTSGEAATFRVYFDLPYYLTDAYDFAGSGTESDPYQIANDAQLIRLSALLTCKRTREIMGGLHYMQTQDIVFSGTEYWVTLGRMKNASKIEYAFTGTYDGGNHLIKNLRVNKTGTYGCGVALFGAIQGATIRNVVIDESCSFSGDEYVAGVVGYADGESLIENCVNLAQVYASTLQGAAYAGGILGWASNATQETTVRGCKNYGAVSGNPNNTAGNYYGASYVGGIVGSSNWPVVNCENYGAVSGGVYVGGVAGQGRVVLACANAGAVRSSTQSRTAYGATGGVVGKLVYGNSIRDVYFEGCYNTGNVIADYPGLGGLVGWAESYQDAMFVLANSYQAGTVTFSYSGANDACAGQLVGRIRPRDSLPTGMYYASKGTLPDYGFTDSADPLTSLECAEDWLRGEEFLALLQNYNSAALTYAVWGADSGSVNLGFPIISGTESKLNYANNILSATVGGVNMKVNEDDQTVIAYLPYNTVSLQSAAATLTLSPDATVFPASGTPVDFSVGPVTYTVTAQDGSTKQYFITVHQASSPDGLAALKIDAEATATGKTPIVQNVILLEEFSQDKYEYTASYTEPEVVGENNSFHLWAIRADGKSGLTNEFDYCLNGTISGTFPPQSSMVQGGGPIQYIDNQGNLLLKSGENTLVLTIGSISYTLKLYLTPTLSDLLLSDGTNDYPVMETEDGWAVNIPADVTTVTVQNAVSQLLNTPVTINGAAETALDITGLNTIEIKAGTEPYQSVYPIKLIRTNTCNVSFTLSPAGALLTVLDKDGQTVNPNADGSYTLIGAEGYTYTYRAALAGYKTKEKVLTAADLNYASKSIELNLVKANSNPDDTLFPTTAGDWTSFRGNPENNGVIDAETPISADNTGLLWAAQLGSSYNNAPTPPMLINGYVYSQVGNTLCRMDPATGEVLASGQTAGRSNYTTNPIACGAGMLFVLIDSSNGGVVQALDAETLTSLWVSEPIRGQVITPLTYHEGYLYTGTWMGETGDGYYFCLPVTDEDTSKTDETQHVLWTLKHKGGFYWAGAYATDKYVVFGSDDGLNGYEGQSAVLYSVNPMTGAVISRIDGLVGDIRSSVAYSDGKLYFSTKGGRLYQVEVDENGNLSNCKSFKMSGMATGTPVIYNGIVFASSLNGYDQFNSPGAVYAVDTADMTLIAQGETRGYNQASLLLSTAYEDEGKLYLYGSYNREPGGLEVMVYDKAAKTITVSDLFEPGKGMQQYGICSPICDASGTIYYKNDSGYVFALKNIKEENESKAAAADALIDAIGTVTLESETKITAAREAYDALTDVQKGLVTKLAALETAEATYAVLRADKDAAEAVDTLIGNIGTVTLESITQIEVARDEYEALTEAQKAVVEKLADLEAAEARYKELAAAATQEQQDAAAAAGVEKQISDIGTVSLEKESTIKAVRDGYDKLTDAQKAKVSNLTVLTAAEAKLSELKTDKAAAEAVEEKITAIGEVSLESEEAITAARSAYDALTEARKALVSNLSVLTAAEAKLKELKDNQGSGSGSGSGGSGSGSSSGKIHVTMRLIGAELAKQDVDLGAEAYLPNYVTWIPTTAYELNSGAMVYDLWVAATTEWGIRSYGAENNYVATVWAPSGYELSEFTNGYRSGWMYTVNGSHPGFGLRYWELHDGDVVIWHYINDYSYECADWFSEAQWPALGDGTYYTRWLMAPDNQGGAGGGVGVDSGSGSGGSNGGSSSGTSSETTTIEPVEVENGVTVSAEVEETGEAKAEVAAEAITEALENTEEEVLTVKVDTEDAENVESVELTLSAEAVKAAAEAEVDLHIETEQGTVKLDAGTLSELAESGAEIAVTVTASEDGSFTLDVTANGETVDATVKVELPATEDSQVLVIVNADGTEEVIKKSLVEDGTVYAELPAGATVKVVENSKDFDDVAEGAWYAEAVDFASSHELFQGVAEGEFAPQNNMTRAMLVTVLFRLEDEPESAGSLEFPDVADGAWYADAVAWAAETELVNGTDKGFEPNANVSREQIATILYRYVKSQGIDVSSGASLASFTDGGETSSWASEAMSWAVNVGLFQGDGGKLNPKGDATRAEVATLMQRLVKLLVK